MPKLWLQCLYGPFTQEWDSMIIVGSSQVRLFFNTISSDAWRNRAILQSFGFLVWIFLTFGDIQEQGLSTLLLQMSLQINTCLFILTSAIETPQQKSELVNYCSCILAKSCCLYLSQPHHGSVKRRQKSLSCLSWYTEGRTHLAVQTHRDPHIRWHIGFS